MSHEAERETTTVPASDGPEAPTIMAGVGERHGDVIGPYRLLQVIGEGGFGVVYLAERREPFTQRVALKVIKPGMDSKAVLARFEQERQALAVMDHPNVAKVLDGGVTSGGRPYFVMEHVSGEAITQYCDRQSLTIRHRLELLVPVCEAVQHAHMKGIIHRDLKPGNILVSVKDGQPIPKVIDFGVAKAVTHTLTARTVFTEHGAMIGTPEYMSPEQAEMGATDIDTRTDVYSLGVVLYELLTGALPLDAGLLRKAAFGRIQEMIRDIEPPRPSTRLTSLGAAGAEVARRRQVPLAELARELRRELEWVPLKAMRKDRARRYQTAADLGRDIQNYLAQRPLHAGPERTSYRLRKFIGRNRGPVIGAAATVTALILGLGVAGVALVHALHAERQRAKAITTESLTRSFVKEELRDILERAEARVGGHGTGPIDLALHEMIVGLYVLEGDARGGWKHLRVVLESVPDGSLDPDDELVSLMESLREVAQNATAPDKTDPEIPMEINQAIARAVGKGDSGAGARRK